jgi:hypothetical protein
MGKPRKVGKVCCSRLIRFTIDGDSILGMGPSRRVRIERQGGRELFSPIALSLSGRRSAGVLLSLALIAILLTGGSQLIKIPKTLGNETLAQGSLLSAFVACGTRSSFHQSHFDC